MYFLILVPESNQERLDGLGRTYFAASKGPKVGLSFVVVLVGATSLHHLRPLECTSTCKRLQDRIPDEFSGLCLAFPKIRTSRVSRESAQSTTCPLATGRAHIHSGLGRARTSALELSSGEEKSGFSEENSRETRASRRKSGRPLPPDKSRLAFFTLDVRIHFFVFWPVAFLCAAHAHAGYQLKKADQKRSQYSLRRKHPRDPRLQKIYTSAAHHTHR